LNVPTICSPSDVPYKSVVPFRAIACQTDLSLYTVSLISVTSAPFAPSCPGLAHCTFCTRRPGRALMERPRRETYQVSQLRKSGLQLGTQRVLGRGQRC
jgi:hypothetical protein